MAESRGKQHNMNAQVQHRKHRAHRVIFSPVNGSLPADELVAVGAGVLHALVHALHMHLQLVVQRESSPAHAARVRLQTLSWVLSKMQTLHYNRLKVVTNEKQGESGRWQMIDIGLVLMDVLPSF
jgi:hypothetical protein